MGRYGLKPEAGRDLLNATMCLIRGMIARDHPARLTHPITVACWTFWKASIRAQLAAAAAPPRAVPRILALTPKGT